MAHSAPSTPAPMLFKMYTHRESTAANQQVAANELTGSGALDLYPEVSAQKRVPVFSAGLLPRESTPAFQHSVPKCIVLAPDESCREQMPADSLMALKWIAPNTFHEVVLS